MLRNQIPSNFIPILYIYTYIFIKVIKGNARNNEIKTNVLWFIIDNFLFVEIIWNVENVLKWQIMVWLVRRIVIFLNILYTV